MLHTAVDAVDGGGDVDDATGLIDAGREADRKKADATGTECTFRSFPVDTRGGGSGKIKVHEVAGSVTLYEGDPGTQCGHDAAASSYFDRLWQKDDKYARYFLCLSKQQLRAGSKISAKGGGAKGKKRVFSDDD